MAAPGVDIGGGAPQDKAVRDAEEWNHFPEYTQNQRFGASWLV